MYTLYNCTQIKNYFLFPYIRMHMKKLQWLKKMEFMIKTNITMNFYLIAKYPTAAIKNVHIGIRVSIISLEGVKFSTFR